MRQLIWFIVIAALATVAAMFLRHDAGYVVVVTPPYRIEISLTLAVAGIVVAFLVVHALLRLVSHTLRMPAQVSLLRKHWRQNRGREALRGSMQMLLEGRYAKSQKLARRAYELDEAPSLAALTAARAAHQMRDGDERDRWLERAAGAPGDSLEARLATRAELLLDERRFEEAREVLRELDARGPKQVATMRLLLRAEQGLQHWEDVLRIVRLLAKRDALAPETAETLRTTATIETLKRKAVDLDTLQAFWNELPSTERREPRVAAAAARQFLALDGCKQAHRVLTDVLNRQWDPELVLLFAECQDQNTLERIEQAEKWLKDRPHDASLLLALGKLCAYQELWGKAQSYLEASLSQTASRATHLELARLFDRMGRESDANLHYRAATDQSLPA
ncbi:MAG: heme biosynthesis protein HemY [Betaproteobacteria bacterium]|jgi:HemY protein|nr:heme biosynthesis protein HemY [Betaproteobacteria bacterium]